MLVIALNEQQTTQLKQICAATGKSPEQMCVFFINDGLSSYQGDADLQELKETLDGEP